MYGRVSKWELGGNNAVFYLSGNLCLILQASPCWYEGRLENIKYRNVGHQKCNPCQCYAMFLQCGFLLHFPVGVRKSGLFPKTILHMYQWDQWRPSNAREELWFQWPMARCSTDKSEILKTGYALYYVYCWPSQNLKLLAQKKPLKTQHVCRPIQWSTVRWVPLLWCLKLSRLLKDIVSNHCNVYV